MALHIVFKNSFNRQDISTTVIEADEIKFMYIDNLEDIAYIEASDTCLASIKQQYKYWTGSSIPARTIPIIEDSKTMYWYGDIARTILLNL